MTTTDRLKEQETAQYTAELLDLVEMARDRLHAHLRRLEGPERREGIRQALDAGIGATELAKGLGISRGRLYQLTERKP